MIHIFHLEQGMIFIDKSIPDGVKFVTLKKVLFMVSTPKYGQIFTTGRLPFKQIQTASFYQNVLDL